MDCDSPAIASRFAYGVLQQALNYTDLAQEQLLDIGEGGHCCPTYNESAVCLSTVHVLFIDFPHVLLFTEVAQSSGLKSEQAPCEKQINFFVKVSPFEFTFISSQVYNRCLLHSLS